MRLMDYQHSLKISDTLLCNLERTARVARLSAFRFFEENPNIEVTFNEFLIIEALYDTPKIHQGDLARILSKGAANLSRDLEKLETRGIIQRTLDTKDKRIVKTLVLTDKGNQLYQNIIKESLQHIIEIENIFDEKEYKLFFEFIGRLNSKLTEACNYTYNK